jgi:hypothetical protein
MAAQIASAGPEWPAGPWETAVVATDDAAHIAEGGAVQDGLMFDIKAGGNDIWGNADQFTYVYKTMSGDFDVAVTVHTLDLTNNWSKAGIMARPSLEPGAINVSVFCRGLDDLVTFQRRDAADGGSASERATPEGAPRPVTLRLTRNGDEFNPGWSLDGGATWEANISNDGVSPTSPVVLALGDPILLGIAVTSHETGVIANSLVEVLGEPSAVRPDAKLAVTWGTVKSHH